MTRSLSRAGGPGAFLHARRHAGPHYLDRRDAVAAADDIVAPPPAGHFAQAHFSHLHDGPQAQALAAGAQVQLGVQVQGSHLQLSVMGELHRSLVEWMP